MTLRLEAVAARLPAVVAGYRARLEATAASERAASETLARWASDPEAANAAIAAAMGEDPRPFALATGDAPDAAFPAPPFTPMTVAGVDGSSIDPDRFAAAPCFVVNAGWAVLPYGVGGEAALDSTAVIGPAGAGDEDSDLLAGGIALLRDVRELEAGARLACERVERGPVVLLLDGTLLPWDLDSRQVPESVRVRLRARTADAFARLQVCSAAASVGSYISASRAGDVVTSLGALAPAGQPAWPQADAWLFRRMLADGDRSGLFRARSTRRTQVEQLLGLEVLFFYVRAGEDIARVELPVWAATAAHVERLHAAIVDQCRRNDGYPRCLQEAHEQAVISGGDREQFTRLLEAEAGRQGLHAALNGKRMSKRRRAV